MWLHEELRNAVVRPRFLCYGKNWDNGGCGEDRE